MSVNATPHQNTAADMLMVAMVYGPRLMKAIIKQWKRAEGS